MLHQMLDYSRFDFWCEIGVNHVAVFLHFLFWAQRDFSAEGISHERRQRVLSAIAERWNHGLAERPLPQL
jgi:hypothetical protein